MVSSLLASQERAVRSSLAAAIGCTPDLLLAAGVHAVARPDRGEWPYVAVVCTFGVGNVISVEPRYLPWVEANLPDPFWSAPHPPFLGRLIARAAASGESLRAGVTRLAFALGSEPSLPSLPPGVRIETLGPGWMEAEVAPGRFPNAVGGHDEPDRPARNRFVSVAFEGDRPLAAAGAFVTGGLFEIGVDVLVESRGQGLGRAVVSACTAEILERGETPYYACNADNIRSVRTALSCGFVPVLSYVEVLRSTA